MLKRVLAFLFVTALSISWLFAQPPKEAAREQYLPVDQLPPSERMPSAPFVVAAYAIIWLLAMFYLWTIWKRTGRLESEIQTLARRQKDAAR
jgi:CcmD family protein